MLTKTRHLFTSTAAVNKNIAGNGNGHAHPGKLTKAALACLAANAASGWATRQPLGELAQDYGISVGSLYRARQLSREEREAVQRGERPLVLPHTSVSPSESVPPAAPVTLSPPTSMEEEATACLAGIVLTFGTDKTLSLLAEAAEKTR
jgi:hypothetical protein